MIERICGLAGVFIAGVGCAYNPIWPDMRTPVDRARDVVSRCTQPDEAVDALVLSTSDLEGVEPAYFYVPSGMDRSMRLRGVRLRFRPKAILSADSLQRSAECHQSLVTLGSAPAIPDDPYALPGSWLDIKAISTGDGYVVTVLIDDREKAQRVVDRARHFAAQQR
jgi:hypothetical protein